MSLLFDMSRCAGQDCIRKSTCARHSQTLTGKQTPFVSTLCGWVNNQYYDECIPVVEVSDYPEVTSA